MDPVSLGQFGAFFEAGPLGVVAVDPRGCIVRVNPVLVQMFGHTPELLAGKPLDMLLVDPTRHRYRLYGQNSVDAARAGPAGQSLELQGRRRDGRVFPVEVNVSHLPLDGCDTTIIFMADVSERAELMRERERLGERERRAAQQHTAALAQLHTFIQSAPIGLAFLDADLRFQHINEHLAALNG
ncbi:MAG: PAS domain S-box protein, partial [Chloroflexales bacterium]|nr:PAS domain S-box protein [Chloroflexales bacterium]